jgi:hypothetical protein
MTTLKLGTVATVIFLVCVHFCAQEQSTSRTAIPAMRQLYVQDQRDRGVLLTDTGMTPPPSAKADAPEHLSTQQISARDAARRLRVRQLLDAGELQSAQDFHDAAFIFQHGQESKDYLLAHILAIEAVVRGDGSSKWISAATLDRYLQAIGQPQVFGTQYSDRDFAFLSQHKGDAAAIAAHKHEDGMTQQPYDEHLMPDPIRLSFCVPTRSQQRKNLKDFEAGGYPKSILPPGCTH